MVDSTNKTLYQSNINNKFAFDVDKHLDKASKGEILDEVSIKLICSKVKELLNEEENVVKVRSPVTIVGDVHG